MIHKLRITGVWVFVTRSISASIAAAAPGASKGLFVDESLVGSTWPRCPERGKECSIAAQNPPPPWRDNSRRRDLGSRRAAAWFRGSEAFYRRFTAYVARNLELSVRVALDPESSDSLQTLVRELIEAGHGMNVVPVSKSAACAPSFYQGASLFRFDTFAGQFLFVCQVQVDASHRPRLCTPRTKRASWPPVTRDPKPSLPSGPEY